MLMDLAKTPWLGPPPSWAVPREIASCPLPPKSRLVPRCQPPFEARPGDIESEVERRDMVQRALAILPARQARVVWARSQGFTLKEIAQEEKRNVETIRRIEAYALRQMRRAMLRFL